MDGVGNKTNEKNYINSWKSMGFTGLATYGNWISHR